MLITQFGTLRLVREPVPKFTKIALIVKFTKIVLIMRRNEAKLVLGSRFI